MPKDPICNHQEGVGSLGTLSLTTRSHSPPGRGPAEADSTNTPLAFQPMQALHRTARCHLGFVPEEPVFSEEPSPPSTQLPPWASFSH